METLDKKITIVKDGINQIIDFAEPTYIPVVDSEYFLVQKVIEVPSFTTRAKCTA